MLCAFPYDLLHKISAFLDWSDLSSLRLSCRQLRWSVVFGHPNALATHPSVLGLWADAPLTVSPLELLTSRVVIRLLSTPRYSLFENTIVEFERRNVNACVRLAKEVFTQERDDDDTSLFILSTGWDITDALVLPVAFLGPPQSPYAGAWISGELSIPHGFPFSCPPCARITSPRGFYHPHVSLSDGEADFIADKVYDWSPAMGTVKFFQYVCTELSDPSFTCRDTSKNGEAERLAKDDPLRYARRARKSVLGCTWPAVVHLPAFADVVRRAIHGARRDVSTIIHLAETVAGVKFSSVGDVGETVERANVCPTKSIDLEMALVMSQRRGGRIDPRMAHLAFCAAQGQPLHHFMCLR